MIAPSIGVGSENLSQSVSAAIKTAVTKNSKVSFMLVPRLTCDCLELVGVGKFTGLSVHCARFARRCCADNLGEHPPVRATCCASVASFGGHWEAGMDFVSVHICWLLKIIQIVMRKHKVHERR